MVITENNNVAQELFRSIRDDGTRWLFVILPDNRWAITCDGHSVVVGSVQKASINSGVEQYLHCIHAPCGPQIQAARCELCELAHGGGI